MAPLIFRTTTYTVYANVIRPANRPAFGGTVPLFFYQMSRVPLNHGNVPLFVRSRIFFARVQFVTLPRCPDINANHPIERNYGNSVRFLAKIQNGTAAESPCYSVFWNAIDLCRLYTSKKKSQCGPCQPSRFLPASPAFFFTRNVPLKTFSRLAGLRNHDAIVVLAPPGANFGSM